MDKVLGQLDENYKIIFERGINKYGSYISTRHIGPLGNPVWGETCLKNMNPEKFRKLEQAMEEAVQ